jgi:cyclic-di-GMP phosphodiesterase TipF (flagellum assembly factor)
VKLDANRLLHAARDGLLGGDTRQFKRVLDSYGIDLIVERIETEPLLLELLDLHIDFGQGYLFGEPRFARLDSNLGA